MSEKSRGYAHRVDIAADAGKVWRAITEPESLKRWCSPDAELQPRQGGLFRARVDRVTEFEAHIDVFEAGRRVRLIYLPNPALPRADSVLTDDLTLDDPHEATDATVHAFTEIRSASGLSSELTPVHTAMAPARPS